MFEKHELTFQALALHSNEEPMLEMSAHVVQTVYRGKIQIINQIINQIIQIVNLPPT